MNNIELKGKRIKIRKHRISDATDIFLNIKDKEISKWTCSIPYPYPEKEAIDFIKRAHKKYTKKQEFNFAIALVRTDSVIGGIGLRNIDFDNKSAEVGYWIGKKFWGKGYTSEALMLALDFAFRKVKLNRVWAKVFEQNKASVKVLQNCNFTKEALMRQSKFRYSKWHNEFIYSILRKEFLLSAKRKNK